MVIATFLFGWFSSSHDAVEDARLLAWTWEGQGIALSVDQPTLARLVEGTKGTEPIFMDTDGGTYSRYTLPDKALDGVAVGSEWRLLSASGERQCTVTGLGMIATPEYQLGQEYGTGAPCMMPLVYADIDCGEGELPWDAVAVPAGSKAKVAVPGEATEIQTPMGPITAALRDEAVRAVRAEAVNASDALQEYLKTELITTTYTLGKAEVVAVAGRFYTGEGYDDCGADDISAEWSGLMIDGVPQGMHGSPDGGIRGVFDLDGDGSPEVLEWDVYGTVLRGADGQVIRRHEGEWCVCGC